VRSEEQEHIVQQHIEQPRPLQPRPQWGNADARQQEEKLQPPPQHFTPSPPPLPPSAAAVDGGSPADVADVRVTVSVAENDVPSSAAHPAGTVPSVSAANLSAMIDSSRDVTGAAPRVHAVAGQCMICFRSVQRGTPCTTE
jgi:hypothetical protein